ncbi:E2F-associated phosphoprotein [Sarcoptes scabiei]|uniref:E2F-associated phosphoprotein n=1 Tax=Sarcoptes scabiei TaxID=52283 RepID=A0A834VBP1_SARSC|nr:E2F-associated phosphoprotein [Sarcoptes scabiei]
MISGFKFLQQTIQDEIDAKDSGDADQDADDLMIVDSNSSLQRFNRMRGLFHEDQSDFGEDQDGFDEEDDQENQFDYYNDGLMKRKLSDLTNIENEHYNNQQQQQRLDRNENSPTFSENETNRHLSLETNNRIESTSSFNLNDLFSDGNNHHGPMRSMISNQSDTDQRLLSSTINQSSNSFNLLRGSKKVRFKGNEKENIFDYYPETVENDIDYDEEGVEGDDNDDHEDVDPSDDDPSDDDDGIARLKEEDKEEKDSLRNRKDRQTNPASSSSSNDHNRSSRKSNRTTAAINDVKLNCPCCLSLLCLDCQRHEIYKTQYRAIFISNLLYADNDGDGSYRENQQQQPITMKDVYYAVHCDVCNTEVAVYDHDEVYHFHSVIDSI